MKTTLNSILKQIGRCTHHLENKSWWIKNNYEDTFNKLLKKFPDITLIREMIYLESNDMDSRPKCKQCKNILKISKKISHGYSIHCSRSCQVKTQQSEINPEVMKQRNIKAGKISRNVTKKENSILYIDYWIKKYGEEGKTKYKEFRNKPQFSKEICIIKFGENEGLKIFNSRQIKWQETLNNKTEEEKIEINLKKDSWKNLAISERTEKIERLKVTMINKGHWIDWNDINNIGLYSDYKIYSTKVRKLTELNNLDTLQHIKSRGKYTYHLDHKFSIVEGFIQNIPIHIIASIHNLEMIPAKKNSSKREKCSIDLEELLSSFF